MTDLLDDRCILFFVKCPEAGSVKTRLAAALQEINSVELYQNFVLDILSTLETLGVTFRICYYPEDKEDYCVQWLGKQYHYIPQKGEDLGHRMQNSFRHAFLEGFCRVVIVGSDSPDLPGDFIEEALTALEMQDSVIGPSFDGGYYIIGFRKDSFVPAVFGGIKWSTDTVFRDTMEILHHAGHKTYLLRKWGDVDTAADLKSLIERGKHTGFIFSKTMSYLFENNIDEFMREE
ncbi:MAG: TIGR04282 family arsenosugar biosynthesis glycosyltransferase [Thermodesulfobacteriota bacterium]|nr:TIGR04282 family arsenosugar biosynthesis glycosyltransferase [Thermodesulfobacteriota bacterium]